MRVVLLRWRWTEKGYEAGQVRLQVRRAIEEDRVCRDPRRVSLEMNLLGWKIDLELIRLPAIFGGTFLGKGDFDAQRTPIVQWKDQLVGIDTAD